MNEFKRIASVTDLSEGQMMAVAIGTSEILLVKAGGKYYAVDEACTHAQGPLSDGTIRGCEVECPWHGSRFNVKTGEVVSPPADENLTRYEVKIEGDDILIRPA